MAERDDLLAKAAKYRRLAWQVTDRAFGEIAEQLAVECEGQAAALQPEPQVLIKQQCQPASILTTKHVPNPPN